jgi:hypothetical protein
MSEEPNVAKNTPSSELPISDPAQDKPGTLWILWVFLALLIYILSIGPAAKFCSGDRRTTQVLEILYFPVFLLDQNSGPVHAFLRWYIVDVWHCK